ncbi:hypothetical protein MMC12_002393 [Toensbergia leucococca]|nr:hypothetical protein [Toensbergia leucococca]
MVAVTTSPRVPLPKASDKPSRRWVPATHPPVAKVEKTSTDLAGRSQARACHPKPWLANSVVERIASLPPLPQRGSLPVKSALRSSGSGESKKVSWSPSQQIQITPPSMCQYPEPRPNGFGTYGRPRGVTGLSGWPTTSGLYPLPSDN